MTGNLSSFLDVNALNGTTPFEEGSKALGAAFQQVSPHLHRLFISGTRAHSVGLAALRFKPAFTNLTGVSITDRRGLYARKVYNPLVGHFSGLPQTKAAYETHSHQHVRNFIAQMKNQFASQFLNVSFDHEIM